MRKTILAFLLAASCLLAKAQTTEVVVEHQHTNHPAVMLELPYPPSVVEKALDDFLGKKGLKGTDAKGLRLYKNFKLHSTHEHQSDLHFKIERKGRKDKDVTILHLIVAKNNEELKSRKYSDNSSLHGAKELMEEFIPTAEAYNLEVEIGSQEESVKKTEKKYSTLTEDQKDLEKKIKNLEEKLEQNKKDQEKQKSEIEKQKTILESMRGRRKA